MKKANFFKKVCVLSMAAVLVGTSVNTAPIEAQAASKASITLSKKKATMLTGKSLTLKVTKVKGLKNKKVKFTSSNPKVVKVSTKKATAKVKLTAKKAGKATITAKSGKAKATCKITVTQGAKKVNLNAKKATLGFKKSMQLVAEVTPAAASQKVTWKTSNKKIATVSKSGKVTTKKKAGKVKITATAKDGSKKKATITITVKKKVTAVKSVKLDKTAVKMNVGSKTSLKATVAPAKASNKNIYWKSSNKKVVTVDQKGNLKAVAAGTATITATANDGSKKKTTCTVTVINPSITLNKTAITLTVGASETLTATVNDEAGTTATWTSSDAKVATVTNGVVKAVAAGTATITAKSPSGLTATCTVTVKAAAAVTPDTPVEPDTEKPVEPEDEVVEITGVTLSETEVTMVANAGSFKLEATVAPATTTMDKAVEWTATGAVAVDEEGVVSVDLSKITDPTVETVTGTVTATTVNDKEATCEVTVVVNTDAKMEADGFYAYALDKAAESYEVTYGDKAVSVSAAALAEDIRTLVAFDDWNNATIKNYWESATVEKLVEKFVLAQELAIADYVEVVDRDATSMTVKATYGDAVKTFVAERTDVMEDDAFAYSNLTITEVATGRVVEINEIKVVADDADYVVTATVVAGGKVVPLRATVAKNGEAVKLEKADANTVIATFDATSEYYVLLINETYYNEMIVETGVADVIANTTVMNNYFPVAE